MTPPRKLSLYADITGDKIPERIVFEFTEAEASRALLGDRPRAYYIDRQTGQRIPTDAVRYTGGTAKIDGTPIVTTFSCTADAPIVNGRHADGAPDIIDIQYKHATGETIYTVTTDAASPDGHALSEECRSYAAQHRTNYALEGGRDSLLDYRPWAREVSKSTHPLKLIPDSWRYNDLRLGEEKKNLLVKS